MHWKCLYRKPDFRYEMEGEPISAGCSLLMAHYASNRLLAVEETLNRSAFGKVSFVCLAYL